MSTHTDGPLDPFMDDLFGFEEIGMPSRLVRLWLKPVESFAPTLRGSVDKPIGQFTITELMAWGATVGYLVMSMALAEQLALNLLRAAIARR